jgi:hypothetical protein
MKWKILFSGLAFVTFILYVNFTVPTGNGVAGSKSPGLKYPQIRQSEWRAAGDLNRVNRFLRDFPLEDYDLSTDIGSAYYAKDGTSTLSSDSVPSIVEGKLAAFDNPWTSNRYGFLADQENYFDKWSCSSSAGYRFIHKLGILPKGSHNRWMYKDSLMMSPNEYSGGFPVIYFTMALKTADGRATDFLTPSYPAGRISRSLFSLKKAYYHSQYKKWMVADVAEVDSPHGISSQDGPRDDYMLNVYQIGRLRWEIVPGEGPATARPPQESRIPGISPTAYSGSIAYYPMFGNSTNINNVMRFGLTDIINNPNLRNPPPGAEFGTCMHLNPSFFDYDPEGRPQKFVASLSHGAAGKDCDLGPLGQSVPLPAGYYVYEYTGPETGWQLESRNPVEAIRLDYAMNYVAGTSPAQMIRGDWAGKIIRYTKLGAGSWSSAETILDCSAGNVALGEPNGNSDTFVALSNSNLAGQSGDWFDDPLNPGQKILVPDQEVFIISKFPIHTAGEPVTIHPAVMDVYRDVLGRNPDWSGGVSFSSQLRTNLITVDGFRAMVRSSPELSAKIDLIYSLVCKCDSVTATEKNLVISRLTAPLGSAGRKTLWDLVHTLSTTSTCTVNW